VTEIWQWTPFMFLIFCAGLASLDVELFDAAKIDGASAWGRSATSAFP
jgi:multiple sugar transport system permease protein